VEKGWKQIASQLFIQIWGSRCMSPSVHIRLSAEILLRICEGSWGEAEESSPL